MYFAMMTLSLSTLMQGVHLGFQQDRATEFDTRAKNWQGPEGLYP